MKRLALPSRGAIPLMVVAVVAALALAALVRGRESFNGSPAATGSLVIYSATDQSQLAEVIAAFAKIHPDVAIRYESLPAQEVYTRTRTELDSWRTSADLVINSSMDLQIKLVNDGYAQPYASPERGAMPSWAVWKNQAYAISSEPIVFGYNKRLLPVGSAPTNHDALAALLNSQQARFKARVGLYDPARSPTGYLYLSQDLHIDRDNWDLIAALGRAQPQLFISTKDMIDQVASGELIMAYNLIGSYAFERARRDPAFGVIVPTDYVLVGSRVALLPRGARNPVAAQKFLDFMLSREGQALFARHNMIPLRDDMQGVPGAVVPANAREIHVGPALMADLDQVNRDRFFDKWTTSMGLKAAQDLNSGGRKAT